jgi:exopolysaccharide biosynthesis protein
MNNKIFCIILFILLPFLSLKCQTATDSLIISNIQWKTMQVEKGVVYRKAEIPSLYNVPQNINIIEINGRDRKLKIGIASANPKQKTSQLAIERNAIAAINGSYFNMQNGNSVCYLKIGKEVIDTTSASEFSLRVTGAIKEWKGRMEIIPWNKNVEVNYTGKKANILASGPLMLQKGRVCDFSHCGQGFINTKHPRSAVCITKDHKILFVTFDGRNPGKAGGVNIPELSHFLKIIGAEYALNLDGGGSTTLWTFSNGILNIPCDNKRNVIEGERKVANILFLYTE